MNKLLSLLLAVFLAISGMTAKTDGSIEPENEAMTAEEITVVLNEAADALTALGIALDRSCDEEIISFYTAYGFAANRAYMASELLCIVGSGETAYDPANGKMLSWTPTSDQVYTFDAEVYDVTNMYAWILQGVESIVPDLHFDHVTEDLSAMVYNDFDYSALYDDEGNLKDLSVTEMAQLFSSMPDDDGSRSVSFTVNGHDYTFIMKNYGDWIDDDLFDHLNSVLQTEDYPYRLTIVSDLYSQTMVVYYGPQDTAASLQELLKWW